MNWIAECVVRYFMAKLPCRDLHSLLFFFVQTDLWWSFQREFVLGDSPWQMLENVHRYPHPEVVPQNCPSESYPHVISTDPAWKTDHWGEDIPGLSPKPSTSPKQSPPETPNHQRGAFQASGHLAFNVALSTWANLGVVYPTLPARSSGPLLVDFCRFSLPSPGQFGHLHQILVRFSQLKQQVIQDKKARISCRQEGGAKQHLSHELQLCTDQRWIEDVQQKLLTSEILHGIKN